MHLRMLIDVLCIVRDVWEPAQPDLEARISALLGVPWKTDIDVAYIYSFAESGYPKDIGGTIKASVNSFSPYVLWSLTSWVGETDTYRERWKALSDTSMNLARMANPNSILSLPLIP